MSIKNTDLNDFFLQDTSVEPLHNRHGFMIRNEIKRRFKGRASCAEIMGYEYNDEEINYYIRVYCEYQGKTKVSAFVFELRTSD